jgi:hypothetical protein
VSVDKGVFLGEKKKERERSWSTFNKCLGETNCFLHVLCLIKQMTDRKRTGAGWTRKTTSVRAGLSPGRTLRNRFVWLVVFASLLVLILLPARVDSSQGYLGKKTRWCMRRVRRWTPSGWPKWGGQSPCLAVNSVSFPMTFNVFLGTFLCVHGFWGCTCGQVNF